MQAKQLLAIEKFQKSRTRRIIGSKENYNECFVKLKEIYSFLHTELQSVLTLSDLIEGEHDNKIGHHKNFKDNNRFFAHAAPNYLKSLAKIEKFQTLRKEIKN